MWFIRGQNIPRGISNELTDNFDIIDTLIKKSNLKHYISNGEGRLPVTLGGKKRKNYTLAQTIFPKKKYESVISNGKFELKLTSKKTIDKITWSDKEVEIEEKFLTKVKKIRKDKKYDLIKYSKKVFSDTVKKLLIKKT